MKKGGTRPYHKRASAAPKERWCGVPCTLLVAAWTLFLLLLLTSSISHEDGDPDARDLEAIDDFATQELTGASLAERHDDQGGDGDDPSSVVTCSDEKSVPVLESDVELHHSHFITSEGKLEQEPSSSGGVVLPSRIVSQELREPIDALQYAEYGAGLLQKSGPAEDHSKICLGRNAGGTSCHVISHRRDFSGKNCIWQAQEVAECQEQPFPSDVTNVLEEDERCHDASSYGTDVVAEIELGGGSYLVCQIDLYLSGTALCGMSCSAQSECVLPGMQSNSSPWNRSLRAGETHQEGHRQREAESLSSEHSNSVESEGLQPPRRSTLPQDKELSSAVDDEFYSNALSQQGVDELEEKAEENANEIPQQILNVEDTDDEGKVVEDASLEQMDVKVEFLSPLVESEVIGQESLIDPGQGVREQHVFDDELLVPLVIEPELLLEEPRRLKRVGSVMSLDEYKRSILESQRKSDNQVNLSSVQAQKVRHSDESYNYASASHGAKVLASNKEAKGASHILTSDKDKYLRNPCGAEDKYVVLELSEETFVDIIFISNFEFHSSNLKDFELLGSTVYPTKDWISLGKFQAENVRHRQKFTVEEPKMVRHLMIKMLTHWGSEFFCTLSTVEVFGVDVIKNLLDDWIALEELDNNARTQGSNGVHVSQEESASPSGTGHQIFSDAALDAPFTEALFTQSETGTGSDQGGVTGGEDSAKTIDGLHGDEDSMAGSTGDSFAQEAIHNLGGKPPGDSVLKILMQRVKDLELNQKLFDLYLGDMTQKYKIMLSELDKDLALVTERLRNETALTASLAMRLADRELQRKEEKLHMERRFAQIASNFTDSLDFMRWQMQSMERREITAILLSFFCMIFSALLLLLARCLPGRNTTRDFPPQTRSSEVKEEVKKEVGDQFPHSCASMEDCFSLQHNSNATVSGRRKLDSLNLSAVCQRLSSFILYLACGLTVIVLSV